MGDMLELGKHSRKTHRQIGEYAYRRGVKRLGVLGEEARQAAEGFIKAGGSKKQIKEAGEPSELVEWLKDGKGNVLVKGSRGMKMERVVEGLLE